MKKDIVKGISLFLMLSIMISCNQKTETSTAATVDKEQIKKEIQAKEDAFAELYNSGQLKDIGYYADDATTYKAHDAAHLQKKRRDSTCVISVIQNSGIPSIGFTL